VASFQIKFDRPIGEVLKKKIEPFTLEVGVLNDAPHYQPAPGKKMKTYAGGLARRVGRVPSGKSIAEVGASARKQLGVNYLTKPFKGSRKSRDAIKVMNEFWKVVFGGQGNKSTTRRLENALQAVIRNPITRGDYGKNKALTAKIKGSKRKFIDTAQLFKAIVARVRRRRSR
jgi:hypothetical protein